MSEGIATEIASRMLTVSPIDVSDILCCIFSNLSPFDLCASLSRVSSSWHKLILNNKLLWLCYCDLLWQGKDYISDVAMKLQTRQPMHAFKMSWIDRQRNVIHLRELTSIKWRFRFKFNSLLNDDENAIFAVFKQDGTLVHENLNFGGRNFRWRYLDVPDDDSTSDDDNEEEDVSAFSLQRSPRFAALNDFDVHSKNSTNSNAATCYGVDEETSLQTTATASMTLTKSRWIKVNHFPALCAFRSAKWGWILQNEQVIFTSY